MFLLFFYKIKSVKNFTLKDFDFIKTNKTIKKNIINKLGKGVEDEFLCNENMFYVYTSYSFLKHKTSFIIKISFDESNVVTSVTHTKINNIMDIELPKNNISDSKETEVFNQIKDIILKDNDIDIDKD